MKPAARCWPRSASSSSRSPRPACSCGRAIRACPTRSPLSNRAAQHDIMLGPGNLSSAPPQPSDWMRFNVAFAEDPRLAAFLRRAGRWPDGPGAGDPDGARPAQCVPRASGRSRGWTRGRPSCARPKDPPRLGLAPRLDPRHRRSRDAARRASRRALALRSLTERRPASCSTAICCLQHGRLDCAPRRSAIIGGGGVGGLVGVPPRLQRPERGAK